MSNKVVNSRFILQSSIVRWRKFYQSFRGNIDALKASCERTLAAIQTAKAYGLLSEVEASAQILVRQPHPEYHSIGHFYLAWVELMRGNPQPEKFMQVAETSRRYHIPAIQALASIEGNNGDLTAMMKYHLAVLAGDPNPSERIESLRGVAVVKAMDGQHDKALADMQSIIPILRHADPEIFFHALNSLAVELGEAGQLDAAERICWLVQRAPMIDAHKGWRDTKEELLELRRLQNRPLRISLAGFVKEREDNRVVKSAAEDEKVVYLPRRQQSCPATETEPGGGQLLSYSLYAEQRRAVLPESSTSSTEEPLSYEGKRHKLLHIIFPPPPHPPEALIDKLLAAAKAEE